MKINKDLATVLLARYMDTEFSIKALAAVSEENFELLYSEISDCLENADITRQDIKDAWKAWFDWAAYNGTLVSPDLSITVANQPCNDKALTAIEYMLQLAYSAIDKL